jgi:hypothetical protein
VFHKTHIDLPRWLIAVWLVCHSPKGISSKQIQRELGVTYKTAWYMTRRIRLAIQKNLLGAKKLGGTIEADAAMVKAAGGSATRRGKSVPHSNVVGIASREDDALRLEVVKELSTREIMRVFDKHIGLVRRIYTDEAVYFLNAYRFAPHETVRHENGYSVGQIHVNRIEGAWSLFKRGLAGVFHFVSAKYLQEYLDEFAFRQSNLKDREALVGLVLTSC